MREGTIQTAVATSTLATRLWFLKVVHGKKYFQLVERFQSSAAVNVGVSFRFWIVTLDEWLNTVTPQKWSVCKFSSQFQWNVSQAGIENEDYHQLKRCDLNITPNSHDYPTKKSIVSVKGMNVSILGNIARSCNSLRPSFSFAIAGCNYLLCVMIDKWDFVIGQY